MSSKILIFTLLLLFMISNTGQIKTRLSSKVNIFFKETNRLKVIKRDAEEPASPTHSTLNEVVKQAFADYKAKLNELYEKFNANLNQIVSLDEELFAEFKTNIKHEINLNQVAISEQTVNFEVYKSETNLEPDRTALLNVIKIENSKDLQSLFAKSDEFESNLNQNLLNKNDISDKYSTIELVNKLFKHAHKYLSKLKSDEMNSMLEDTNDASNNNNKLEIVMTRSDKFRLRKQDEIDMLRGIFEQRAEMSNTNIDIFFQMLALQIENLKTSLDARHDQLNADLVQAFSLLNANMISELNTTFTNLIEKIASLYPRETSLTLKQLNQTITNSFDQFKSDLIDVNDQDEYNLNRVIESDEQLFREFTENILDNIKVHGIQGHINESLIKYEANKSFFSLELDREAYRNQIRDVNSKSLNEFIIKLNQSEHELKQNLTQIDYTSSVETLSLMNSYYDIIDSLYEFKLSADLAEWEHIKAASDEFNLRKQDETNMLRELLQNHAAHSELFVSSDQRQNHTVFVNFLQEEINSFKLKLEKKHEKMLADLKLNLNESSWRLVESFNSTHHELIETIKKLYALFQTDVNFQVGFSKLKEDETSKSDNQEDSLNSTQQQLEQQELTTTSSSESTNIAESTLGLVDDTTDKADESILGLDGLTSKKPNDLIASTEIADISESTEENKQEFVETTTLSLANFNENIEPNSNITSEGEFTGQSSNLSSDTTTSSTTFYIISEEPAKNVDSEERSQINEGTTSSYATNETEMKTRLESPYVVETTSSNVLNDTITAQQVSQQSNEDNSFESSTTPSTANEIPSTTNGLLVVEENQENIVETTSLSLDSSIDLSSQTDTTIATVFSNSAHVSYPQQENMIGNSSSFNNESRTSVFDQLNEDQQTSSSNVDSTTVRNSMILNYTTSNDESERQEETLDKDSSNLIESDDDDDDDETNEDEDSSPTDSTELENLYKELLKMSASTQDELDPLERSASTQKLPQTNIIDYLQFNQGIKCVTGFLFKYTNNETKLIGKQGIVEKKISLLNRKIQSLKKLVINGMDFIQICSSDLTSANRTCDIIRNKYKKINVIDFDLEALKLKTSKSYQVLGLFGSYDSSIKCVSKIGVIYKEVKAVNFFAGTTRSDATTQKIKYINFNLDKECIKGLEQVYGENDIVKVGFSGARKRKIEFENKELVSLKLTELGGRGFIEFCFYDTELDEKTCDKIRNNYENLTVSEFDLDDLNSASKAKYEAIGLNGSFEKTKNCLKKLKVEYKAMCGTRDTVPC